MLTDAVEKCGTMYHTSAAYDILGIATEMYSCRIPLAEIPVDVRASRRTRLIHTAADLAAWSLWAVHFNFGSNRTPRNRCNCTELMVVILCERG